MKISVFFSFCFFAILGTATAQPTYADLINAYSNGNRPTATQSRPAAAPVTTPTHRTPPPIFGNNAGRRIMVPMGTEVLLSTQNLIEMTNVSVGQTISFLVYGDVVIDGKTVIRTNTRALGTVTRIDRPTSTRAGRIGIRVDAVVATNGESVALNGTETLIEAPMRGMSSEIAQGTLVRAYTLNNQEIQLP